METTLWDYSNMASKLLIYLGGAAAIGGPFIAALISPLVNKKSIINYIIMASVVGFIAVITNFFIRVGAFSETGLSGMFDTEMISFIWQSAVSDSLLWRLSAFTLLGFALFFGNINLCYERFSLKHAIFTFLYVTAIFSFAYSFAFVGHSADISRGARWLIGFHVVAVAWWIGALYPLWVSCKLLKPPELYKLMNLFGQIAVFMVGLLIACGIGLLFLFFANPLELFTTKYGQAILLKLTFVVCILLIAAYHKYHLVAEANCHKLQKSIRNEMLIAVMILTITAVLSYFLGPVSLA